MEVNLELFHVQTQRVFEIPYHASLITFGKSDPYGVPEIEVSELPDASIVSRRHCRIHRQGEKLFLEDLNSSNGTFLNGEKLLPQTHYPLRPGDRFSLGQGDKVTFVCQLQGDHFPSPETTQLQVQEAQPRLFALIPRRLRRSVAIALMVAAGIVFAASTDVGIFVSAWVIFFFLAGAVLLVQNRVNRNWGWGAIALGVVMMLLRGRVFARVNLLTLLLCGGLFGVGFYLLYWVR